MSELPKECTDFIAAASVGTGLYHQCVDTFVYRPRICNTTDFDAALDMVNDIHIGVIRPEHVYWNFCLEHIRVMTSTIIRSRETVKDYYKFVSPTGHRGMKYKNGLNTDKIPFNPSGDCEPGGIYFAKDDILSFIDYGSHLYKVTPVGAVYENPGLPKKWKAHSLIMKRVKADKRIDQLIYLLRNGVTLGVHKLLGCISPTPKNRRKLLKSGVSLFVPSSGYSVYTAVCIGATLSEFQMWRALTNMVAYEAAYALKYRRSGLSRAGLEYLHVTRKTGLATHALYQRVNGKDKSWYLSSTEKVVAKYLKGKNK